MTQSKHTPAPFIDALSNYTQADEEGLFVNVSRQAIHETIKSHAELLGALEYIIKAHDCDREMKMGVAHLSERLYKRTKAIIAKAGGQS